MKKYYRLSESESYSVGAFVKDNICHFTVESNDIKHYHSFNMSALLEQINIAIPSPIYKQNGTVVLFNSVRFSMNKNELVYSYIDRESYMKGETFVVKNLKHLKDIVTSMQYPKHEVEKVCYMLEIHSLDDFNLDHISNPNIPSFYDNKHWRYLKTLDAIVYHKIWQMLNCRYDIPAYASTKMIRTQTSSFYSKHVEYAENDWKRDMVSRKVILPFHNPTSLVNDGCLVTTSTPQSEKAGLIAELSIGTKIDKYGYSQPPLNTLGVTDFQSCAPYHSNENRHVVRRALSQFVTPLYPEERKVVHESSLKTVKNFNIEHKGEPNERKLGNPKLIPGLSILTAFIHFHGLDEEDGVIISESCAKRLTSYKYSHEIINVSSDAYITIDDIDMDRKLIINDYDELMKSKKTFVNNGILGYQTNSLGEQENITSNYNGVITKLIRSERKGYDIIEIETLIKVKPEVGLKIVDGHSNKGTITIILPDDFMPKTMIDGKMYPIQMIRNPNYIKRGTPSLSIEMKESIESFKKGKPIVISDDYNYSENDKYPITSMTYSPYTVSTYGDVGFIHMYVLNHIPREKLKYSGELRTNHKGMTGRGKGNYNFTEAMYVFEHYGLESMINEIQSYSSQSRNSHHLDTNLRALGLQLENDIIEYTKHGMFSKKPYDNVPIIKKFSTEDDVTDTLLDPKYTGVDVQIEIPNGILLCSNDILKEYNIPVSNVVNSYRKLTKSDDVLNDMKESGIKISNITNNGNKCYILIPGNQIELLTSPTGDLFPTRTASTIDRMIRSIYILSRALRKYDVQQIDSHLSSINRMFNSYLYQLIGETITKKGILRETLSPRVPFSMYGVFSNGADLDINEVEIPIRSIREFMKSPDFCERFNINRNMKTNAIISHFQRHNHRILVMRQPAHERNEVNSFLIRVHVGNTIRIHPFALKYARGDFDGDTGIAAMFIEPKSNEELKTLAIENQLDKILSNIGEYDTIPSVKEAMIDINSHYEKSLGKSMSMVIADGDEIYVKYNEYIRPSKKKFLKSSSKAALEYLSIKELTAFAGGIGNSIRHIFAHVYGVSKLAEANNIYHNLAQSALDIKHSKYDPIELRDTLSMVYKAKDPGIYKLRTSLETLLNKDQTSLVVDILYDNNGEWKGGISTITNRETPFATLFHRGTFTNLLRSTSSNDSSVPSRLNKRLRCKLQSA